MFVFCFRSTNGWYIKKSQFVAIILRIIGFSFRISSQRLMYRPLWLTIRRHVASQCYRYAIKFLSATAFPVDRHQSSNVILVALCVDLWGSRFRRQIWSTAFRFIITLLMGFWWIVSSPSFSRPLSLDRNDNNRLFIVLSYFFLFLYYLISLKGHCRHQRLLPKRGAMVGSFATREISDIVVDSN